MPHQRPVHRSADRTEVRGVDAEHRGRELVERRARAAAVGRKVGGAERAHLAEAFDAVHSRDPDDGARQRLDDAAAATSRSGRGRSSGRSRRRRRERSSPGASTSCSHPPRWATGGGPSGADGRAGRAAPRSRHAPRAPEDARVLREDVLQVLGGCERPSRISRANPRICSSSCATIGRFAPRAILMWNSSSRTRKSSSLCASGGPLLTQERQLELVDLLQRHHAAGGLDRDLLERLADPQHLVAMTGREAADDELAARPDLEQALGAEELQRLAHRRFRDAELVGEPGLGDAPSRPAGRRAGCRRARGRTPCR